MGLDFSYTCPKIDKEIDRVKSIIENHLEDYIKQLCPLMSTNTVCELRSQWTKEIYDRIESSIETIRETNKDMRNQAEKQINQLNDEVSELREEITKLERKLDVVF
jgi:DNA repair exonuclease SbcCD ATPase subunit